jgi:putative peptide zinc metalloprotease protein
MFPLPQSPTEAPAEDGWVFPWDHPREPREGDNQALAINTEDGSTVVDVALALVWVRDGGPVDQWNDAWALASCTGCTTTAIAFQTLIVVGYGQIITPCRRLRASITPVNAAVAANYACEACQTHALALQLVATLAAIPDEVALATSPRFGRSSKSSARPST